MTQDESKPNEWATLSERIQSGDSVAEEEFAAHFRFSVFSIAVARTRNRATAEDLAQDILIAVLRALRSGQVRETKKLPAFIQGTARNLINNYFERAGRRAESALDTEEMPRINPIAGLEMAERSRLIRQELETYSTLDQQILLFTLVDGHSSLEVAARLKMSHEAVRARKSRLVRKLTKKFKGLSQK